MMPTAPPNRLARETSPYLLQHQCNPVDWFPWGAEALERSLREDKPVFLSIGYAACHWCHVMERESFEDSEVAALMNEHFVCIKVDREERPDLDEIYMAATVALNGSGGWPMSVFLTPDQRPFFAGTYFPPEDRWGRPGFKTLLARIAQLWATDREQLLTNASELTLHLQTHATATRPTPVARDTLSQAVRELERNFDKTWGGFGLAPKFPPSTALHLLLREQQRTGDANILLMVEKTLTAMSQGGIYDHVAGGFARYSTDERWFLPHFEKMLYDNAQLARVYLEAFQVTANADFARVARETLDYVLREMQSDEGGFYCATDADSEGEEGKFFVWSQQELEELLEPAEFELFCSYYAVTEPGNWEGRNLLHTPRTKASVASELTLSLPDFESLLESAKRKVYAARKLRIPPLLDDKVLVSWNALMLAAMADGYRVLGDERYLDSAERAAVFLRKKACRPDTGLFRTYRDGRAHLNAYLEDYAFLSDGLISLYEAGGNEQHLLWATSLLERLIRDFGDDAGGGFFHTAHTAETLIVRLREGHDSALPNANAIAAQALTRLAEHLDREDFRAAAQQALLAYGQQIELRPRAFPSTLCALDRLLTPSVQLVISAESRGAAEPLVGAIGKTFLPNQVTAWSLPNSSLQTPLLREKRGSQGKATLYICRDFSCSAPITAPTDVARALEAVRNAAFGDPQRHLRAPLRGHATSEGTAAFRDLFLESHTAAGYSKLADLHVSRLGFGTYRVSQTDETHRAALLLALRCGVNLIDTSTNYTGGSSERLVGDVLFELVTAEEIKREEIVVVSKVGYAQGQALELVKARAAAGRPFAEMVQYRQDLWHSIHPEWLAEQITHSLTRLGLTTLDVCLLHNPEYYLSFAKQEGMHALDARAEFYRRVTLAFTQLEREVARGRIRFYGVSSNTLAHSAEDAEATDLNAFFDAAVQTAGAEHHFRVIQLPFNLLESAAVVPFASTGFSVLERAEQLGLAVLTNRPLNAISEGAILRLADIPERTAPTLDFEQAQAKLSELELEFAADIAPALTNPDGRMPKNLFNWAVGLSEARARITTRQQFLDLQRTVVEPHVAQLKRSLAQALPAEAQAKFSAWHPRYTASLALTLEALETIADRRSTQQNQTLRSLLEAHSGTAGPSLSMSQLALTTLLDDPGVCSVLLGMRSTEYVTDALAVLQGPRRAPARAWLGELAAEALAHYALEPNRG